jgi:hypothetical protein
MGHVVHLQSREQFVAAIGVLNELPGTWHSKGSDSAPVLLVLDPHYDALVKAGVIAPNGEQGKANGKKTSAKKVKS